MLRILTHASPGALAADYESRTECYMAESAKEAQKWFTPQGGWQLRSKPLLTRERFWICFALFAQGQDALANEVIRASKIIRDEYDFRSSFNIFNTNIATVLLLKHRESMEPDVTKLLEGMVVDGFATWAGNRAPDYQFHGFNDNMPSKAILGLILGGELLGNQEAVEHGLWSLRQMASILSRRGINSEFNSPTYTPLTIHAFAELAAHARNEEARTVASQIETRLWWDLAVRFHPETGMLAGPYSRAYTIDVLGQVSAMSSLLWFLFGDRSFRSPLQFFEKDHELVLHHCGNLPFNISQMCWYAAGEYHVSDECRSLFEAKSYPFHSIATAEVGASTVSSSAPVRLETFMQPDFTVGTSNIPFLNGIQSAPYFVTYRKKQDTDSCEDVGTIFTKMVYNDATPGKVVKEDEMWDNEGEQSNLDSLALTYTMQSDGTAMVLTCPRGHDLPEENPISKISELVLFPSRFGGADEIRIGSSEQRSKWSGQVEKGQWVGCRLGRFLVAIRPLGYTRTMGLPSIHLEEGNGYQFIRTTFYDGEPSVFTHDALADIYGGFMAEHASLDQYPSLEAFMKDLENTRIADYFWTTRRVRYQRPMSGVLPELEMESSWTPGSPVTRFSEINRKPIDWPCWQASAPAPLAENLPFLGEDRASVPHYFPWEHLRCVQADWPWAIGDSGE